MVSAMWNTIFGHYFTLPDGYAHRPEYRNRGGYTDLSTVSSQLSVSNMFSLRKTRLWRF